MWQIGKYLRHMSHCGSFWFNDLGRKIRPGQGLLPHYLMYIQQYMLAGVFVWQTWALILGKGSVFENGRFGSRFHFRLVVLVGVLDFETPTKRFC